MPARTAIIAICLILVCACPGPALGEGGGGGCLPEIVGSSSIASDARGVFVKDDYAYVADAKVGLYVLDVKNPASLEFCSLLEIDSGATKIFVSSLYAFLISGDGYLYIVKIENPSRPVVVKTVFLGLGSCWRRIFVSGGYVHLANSCAPDEVGASVSSISDASYFIVDARDPEKPSVRRVNTFPYENFTDVCVQDGVSFLRGSNYSEYNPHLLVYDASDPDSPEKMGDLLVGGMGTGLDVSGSYAYTGHGMLGIPPNLSIYDVSSPDKIQLAGSAEIPECCPDRIQVNSGLAYLSVSESNNISPNVYIVDVNDPAWPSLTGSVAMPDKVYDLYQNGNYLFVANGAEGLQVVRLQGTQTPAVISSLNVKSEPKAVDVGNEYACLAAQDSGLLMVDIKSPAQPSLKGEVSTPGSAVDVSLDGNYAYVADQGSGLLVVDISSPAFPKIVGSAGTPDNMPCRVYAGGGYAYVANNDHGLIIYDVNSPAKPTQIGALKTSGAALDVQVVGSLAYVATSKGLCIVDVSTPSSPALAGAVQTSGPASGIQVSGSYAYLLFDKGLAVIDVSTPSQAKIKTSFETPAGPTRRVFLHGRHAYLADDQGLLQIIDLSDPAQPKLFKEIASSNAWTGVHVGLGNVFLVGTGQNSRGLMELLQSCLY